MSNQATTESPWTDASKWLPMGPHTVLATDSEGHYLVNWNGTEWLDASTDEPIDSVITYWMELPEIPE